METWQIVMRMPYQDCSGVIQWLKGKAHRILVTQHDADEDIKSTHCHIAIEPSISDEGVRKHLKLNNVGGVKYSIMKTCLNTKTKYLFDPLAVYCIKGDKSQVVCTTLEDDRILHYESLWVNRVKKLDVDLTTTDIITGSKIETYKTEWDRILSSFKKTPDSEKFTMMKIRKYVISYYLQQSKPPPRAGDVNRYSYALWAIVRNKTDIEDIQEIDETYSSAFGVSY